MTDSIVDGENTLGEATEDKELWDNLGEYYTEELHEIYEMDWDDFIDLMHNILFEE